MHSFENLHESIVIRVLTRRFVISSVTILGLRVVTSWSSAWINSTFPAKWAELGSPLATCSAYGDFTCSVRNINKWCLFNYQRHAYHCNGGPYVRLAVMPNMLFFWNEVIIFIIIVGVQKIPTTSWVVKILFPDVPMARRPSSSRVMRFEQMMLHWQQTRNVTLAKRERDVTRKLL